MIVQHLVSVQLLIPPVFTLISVEAAVAAFAQARAPGIYKGDYLKELFRRYGDEEDAPAAPTLPEWCFEDDGGEVDDDGNAVNQESGPSSSGSTLGKRKKEKLKLVGLACTYKRKPHSTRWMLFWQCCLNAFHNRLVCF